MTMYDTKDGTSEASSVAFYMFLGFVSSFLGFTLYLLFYPEYISVDFVHAEAKVS